MLLFSVWGRIVCERGCFFVEIVRVERDGKERESEMRWVGGGREEVKGLLFMDMGIHSNLDQSKEGDLKERRNPEEKRWKQENRADVRHSSLAFPRQIPLVKTVRVPGNL